MADSESTSTEAHPEYEDKFSEYLEKTLPEGEEQELASHLGECEACQASYQAFESAVSALSDLHKMSAPPDLGSEVEETIHRRSAGRFFGRKAFGDRVPFELLAIIALIVGLAVFVLLRSSSTGSLRYEDESSKEPQMAPGAKEAVPQPERLDR